ncbi:MAG: hypothetical protein ABJF10_28885 [Chthoniobacter sp.]|uniref:hypothetical protein n=1 Tax=Chthoniobacter sp. TaxID=2510640 RepID=UPI0032AB13D3
MRLPLLCLFVAFLLGSAHAAEPFFKKNDVIALVGGEDMVVASEYGYLELLLTRALPDYHLRFRSLAWEGDTVYEQRRDLNFPTWEEQLDKIGATVVICQFGQMESLDGKEKLPEFIAAYEKLLERLRNGGKRRVVIVSPNCDAKSPYGAAIEQFTNAQSILFVMPYRSFVESYIIDGPMMRDGIHLNEDAHSAVAYELVRAIQRVKVLNAGSYKAGEEDKMAADNRLRQLIVAKNKLWFDYWRVQNWAFLAGDRTNQPSSRDWRDPSKRWFPAEREEFLPLIEAKEKEIDALAAKLK